MSNIVNVYAVAVQWLCCACRIGVIDIFGKMVFLCVLYIYSCRLFVPNVHFVAFGRQHRVFAEFAVHC